MAALESNLKGLKALAREAIRVEKETAEGLGTGYTSRVTKLTNAAIAKVSGLKRLAPKGPQALSPEADESDDLDDN